MLRREEPLAGVEGSKKSFGLSSRKEEDKGSGLRLNEPHSRLSWLCTGTLAPHMVRFENKLTENNH